MLRARAVRGGGVYYLTKTIELTPADNGLTLRGVPGENATVSGGVLLAPKWREGKRVGKHTVWVSDLAAVGLEDVLG